MGAGEDDRLASITTNLEGVRPEAVREVWLSQFLIKKLYPIKEDVIKTPNNDFSKSFTFLLFHVLPLNVSLHGRLWACGQGGRGDDLRSPDPWGSGEGTFLRGWC